MSDSTDETSAVVLRTSSLTKRFGERTAVNALSMEVHRGDVFGLLGPNGSGKTTTLRMVLGLVWPTGGDIALFGEHVSAANRRELLRRVGAIIEQPAFYPYLTGRENLRTVSRFAGLAASDATRKRIDEALELVGLALRAQDSYKTYSLGMKQRLGIAAALLTEPDLILLDEPTNGLDPAGMVEVRGLIQQLSAQGVTVLLSSHLLYEVQQVCTRVAIINQGSVVAQGKVTELLSSQASLVMGFAEPAIAEQAMRVLTEASQSAAPWLQGLSYVAPESGAWTPPGGWLLRADAPPERAPDITALLAAQGVYVAELRHRELSLEQYFLQLTTPEQGA
ncbi:MAG TPA: ABC transporter ATP-binding protein [Ktedonobacterales bacterium]